MSFNFCTVTMCDTYNALCSNRIGKGLERIPVLTSEYGGMGRGITGIMFTYRDKVFRYDNVKNAYELAFGLIKQLDKELYGI